MTPKKPPQEDAPKSELNVSATGEEAYTITILLREYAEKTLAPPTLENNLFQIFATDIDNKVIETTRAGVYPENIAADVSQERLRRFFTKKDATYQVKQSPPLHRLAETTLLDNFAATCVIINEKPENEELMTANTELAHKMTALTDEKGRVTAVPDSDGHISRYYTMISDITVRVKAKNAMWQSEEKYRILFENNEAGIAISNSSGQVLAANKAIQCILGFSQAELAQINMKNIYVDQEARQRFLNLLAQNGKVENFEAQMRTKTGELIWTGFTSTVIEYRGENAVLTTIVDITEQKQTTDGRHAGLHSGRHAR